MHVLLTGHQGYLGSVLAPVLVTAGHDVVGMDSGLYADCVLGPQPADPPGYPLDVRDVRPEHLTGFDAVVHLAALSNDPLGSLAPEVTYAVNHHATVRLARLAKDAGVCRFLYASTCSVYGSTGSDDLVNEDTPLRPVTPYAESKIRVEDDLATLADSGFSPVFLRNATAFGFSPRLRADIVLNNLVGHAVLSGTVRVLSDGTPWRPLVHARDIAEAFLAALQAPRETLHAVALNVGTEQNNLRVSEIADAVAAAVPGARVAITGENGADPRSYRVDFSRIRTALPDFRCMWSVPAGAAELAKTFTVHGLTRRTFEHSFTRLTRLNDRIAQGSLDVTLRPVQVAEP